MLIRTSIAAALALVATPSLAAVHAVASPAGTTCVRIDHTPAGKGVSTGATTRCTATAELAANDTIAPAPTAAPVARD